MCDVCVVIVLGVNLTYGTFYTKMGLVDFIL